MIATVVTNIIIIACILLIIIVGGTFLYKHLRRKKIIEKLEQIAEKHNLKFEKSNDKKYDFLLISDAHHYLIKLAYIPSNSAVTVNSKDTWCLTWGGHKGNSGRVYPSKRYLVELVPFLRMKDSLSTTKVVILYPDTEKVLKYLNESEIEVVPTTSNAYKMKIITFRQLDDKFIDIL